MPFKPTSIQRQEYISSKISAKSSKMIGTRKIRLTPQERLEYKQRISKARLLSGSCEEILKNELKKRLDIEELSPLQFKLTVPPPSPGQRTDADILEDDSWIFSRFKVASNCIYKSAYEMGSWELKDESYVLNNEIKKQIVPAISSTLKENDIKPPEEPTFPNLEERLNDDTKDFLDLLCSDGHCKYLAVDNADKTLMYLVRNFVIIREFQVMLDNFAHDLGRMSE